MSLQLNIKPFQIAGFVFGGDEVTLPANAVTHVGIVKSSLAVAQSADGTNLDESVLWVCCATTDDADVTLVVQHDLLAQLDASSSSDPIGGDVQEFVAGTDFTAGTTTFLTLSEAFTDESQFLVFFDGLLKSNKLYTYEESTKKLTFSAAIPLGTSLVSIVPFGAAEDDSGITKPLIVNGSAGTAGMCLVSQGSDLPPTWAWVDAVPVGGVVPFAVNSVPTGWLLCNGGAVSRTGYANLYAKIGTTYGAGNGSTTFNLPDLRGEFVRGADLGRGVDSSRVVGSSQADLLKAHAHTASSALRVGTATDGNANICSGGGDAGAVEITISSTGGTETRPRNVALVYCIKATASSSANNNTGTPSQGDNTLPRKTFQELESVSGVLTLDLDSTTGLFHHTLAENITNVSVIYTTTPGVTSEAAYFQLVLKQHSTAAKTVALPASWKSMSGTFAMPVTLGASAIIEGTSYDGGATWLVTFVLED